MAAVPSKGSLDTMIESANNGVAKMSEKDIGSHMSVFA